MGAIGGARGTSARKDEFYKFLALASSSPVCVSPGIRADQTDNDLSLRSSSPVCS